MAKILADTAIANTTKKEDVVLAINGAKRIISTISDQLEILKATVADLENQVNNLDVNERFITSVDEGMVNYFSSFTCPEIKQDENKSTVAKSTSKKKVIEKPEKWDDLMTLLAEDKMTPDQVMDELGIKKTTYYVYKKMFGGPILKHNGVHNVVAVPALNRMNVKLTPVEKINLIKDYDKFEKDFDGISMRNPKKANARKALAEKYSININNFIRTIETSRNYLERNGLSTDTSSTIKKVNNWDTPEVAAMIKDQKKSEDLVHNACEFEFTRLWNNHDDVKDIMDFYNSNFSIDEIAKTYSTTKEVINKIIRKSKNNDQNKTHGSFCPELTETEKSWSDLITGKINNASSALEISGKNIMSEVYKLMTKIYGHVWTDIMKRFKKKYDIPEGTKISTFEAVIRDNTLRKDFENLLIKFIQDSIMEKVIYDEVGYRENVFQLYDTVSDLANKAGKGCGWKRALTKINTMMLCLASLTEEDIINTFDGTIKVNGDSISSINMKIMLSVAASSEYMKCFKAAYLACIDKLK